MAHVQLKTPEGEELVVLPKADYQRLMEASNMLADIAAYDAAQAEIAAGAEAVPASVVNALLAGENPVRVWREHRGLSASDLAREAGLSAPYIHQIESGVRRGRADTLKAIAVVLRVDLDDLV